MKRLKVAVQASLGAFAAAAVILTVVACTTFPLDKDPVPLDPWVSWGSAEPEFVILILPQEMVQAVCEVQGGFRTRPGYMILACVDEIGPLKPGAACLITISGDLWKEKYDKVLAHEKAHCRGWRHGDPQPRGTF